MRDQYYGAINPNRPIYEQGPAMAPANQYARYGAGDSFADNYAPLSQANAVSLDRKNTQAQNDYYNKAADMQNRGALQGLGLLGQQRSNAYERQDAMRNMRNKWMSDMMGPGLLGGLL